MIVALRIISTLQFTFVAFSIIRAYLSGYPGEGAYPFLLLLGALAALVSSFFSSGPSWILFAAAGANILAIVAYCVPPFVVDGKAQVGFVLMLSTGLILVVIGPPAINAILLVSIATQRPKRLDGGRGEKGVGNR
jgi:hypothetical protein